VQGIRNQQAFLQLTLFAPWRKNMASNEIEPSTPDEDELIELIRELQKTVAEIQRRLQPPQQSFNPNDQA
jgi:hypothetical protein